MKNKLLSFFLAFVRKTFSEQRIMDLIHGLLDILYDDSDPLEEGSDEDV